MRRTPIAHVIFPQPSVVFPVPEFSLAAARGLAGSRGLDVEVLMPLPHKAARRLQDWSRRRRSARAWPPGIDEALGQIEPRPTLVPYLPVPGRSVESATVALAAALIARSPSARPVVLSGAFLDQGGFAAAMAARTLGASSIAIACGTDVRVTHPANAVVEPGRARRTKQTLKSATSVLAVSYDLAGQLARLGRTAEVVRFTASPERFPLLPPAEGAPVVLFVGRVSRGKGVDLLLEAFARIRRPDARLRLVGPAFPDLDAAREAARLGIADRVELIGEVAQEELLAAYRGASCLALPSRAEGFPVVLVEALLTGRPVVAADVGGVSEMVDATVGRLIPPEDPAALALALDEVLEARDREAWQPERLRAHALPMSWAANLAKLEALTWELINGRA
jgi:glycosyltransferase involved in cell wall biosynthesis